MTTTTEKSPAMITRTGSQYLELALDKASSPLHPNFAAKMKPKTLAMYTLIRSAAAREVDARHPSPKHTAVYIGRALKGDLQAYVQFFKDLMSDAAFAAHMDIVRLQRHVDGEQLESTMDAMLETHDGDGDTTVFDRAINSRSAAREGHDGTTVPDEAIATSVEDAYAAIHGLQAWIGLAFSAFTDDQQQYWGVEGLMPFAQRKDVSEIDGEATYVPIRDFDAYREWQDAQWKAKRNTVPDTASTEELMLA